MIYIDLLCIQLCVPTVSHKAVAEVSEQEAYRRA